ncbi:amnionless domain-containing protein [Phthorimaea operculella]|nr:amnionless domain-containing protein [Phthorimaea operculella]
MRAFLLFITISVSSTAVVEWTPNTSFDLAINFRDHKLPCSKQSVVFPESVQEVIDFVADVAVKEFILPKNGELLFDSLEEVIAFGPEEHDNCTETGTAYYAPRKYFSWNDPDVWSSSKFNAATPDAERIPCYNDDVVFPDHSQFTLAAPDDIQYVQSLSLGGIYQDTDSFQRHALMSSGDAPQQFLLNNYFSTGVVITYTKCNNPSGCPCQTHVLKINCELKFCPAPKCLNPIQPVGHCCKICGGYIVSKMGPSFDTLVFEENVAKVIESYGKDKLVYHIGILPDNRVQVVVVEKGEYDGTSTQAIQDIEYGIDSKVLQTMAYFSGIPTSESGMSVKIAFSMFFAVVFVMGAIYVYYYRKPDLPVFNYPMFARNTRRVVSRFNARSESVVSLTSRRDSTATTRSGFGTAFRNPMYDSKRGRVEVTEPVSEED